MNKIIVTILTLISSFSYASKEVGNGGDVVACFDGNKLKSAELLDYYEARVMRNLNPVLTTPATDEKTLVQIILSRLETRNPSRYRYYLEFLEDFYVNRQILHGIELTDVTDSHQVFLPKGCKVIQAIIQREPYFPEDKRYVIDGDLWAQLNLETRAGLILHEIIYRETILAGQVNSISARYFHAYLAADKIRDLNLRQYIEVLDRAQFPDFDNKGVNLLLCMPKMENGFGNICGQRDLVGFYDNDNIILGIPVPHWAPWVKKNVDGEKTQSVIYKSQKIEIMNIITWNHQNQGGGIESIGTLPYKIIDVNGVKVVLSGLDDKNCYINWGCANTEDFPRVGFYKSGELRYFKQDNQNQFKKGTETIECSSNSYVQLSIDGQLISCSKKAR